MTDSETTDNHATEIAGVGGIVGDRPVSNLQELVDVILDKRETLSDNNQKNVEIFNQLQKIAVNLNNSLTVLNGAIAGISEFVTEETPEDDNHIVRLEELKSNRTVAIEELKLTNSKRNLLISTIQANEITLGVLNSILETAGSSDIKTTDLSKLKTVEQTLKEISENS